MTELLPFIALQYLNIPYIYGGKSPLTGLDCSGVVCEILQAYGIVFTNTEINSQQLYDQFKDKPAEGKIQTGDLAFFGTSITGVNHVAMFLDNRLIIEAGHGTSDIKTVAQAQARDAKVRVRPFNYRRDLVGILRPNYIDKGESSWQTQ